jgi:predicted NBD/HSP70 family sugar kinase
VLQLLRADGPLTRAEVAERCALSAAAVAPRVSALVNAGLVVETRAASTGGRPAGLLTFQPDAGVVLVADFGRTHSRLGVADLSGNLLAERAESRPLGVEPDVVLRRALDMFGELLTDAHRAAGAVVGIGVGVPGPIEFRGRPFHPTVLPGWDGVDIAAAFRERFDVAVVVDNDANAEAIGEHRAMSLAVDDLLYVKCGTGIGCGIVVGGMIRRGAQGASGEIGHVRISSAGEAECRCGNNGCLETVASGRALAEQLTALGCPAADGREVVALLRQGEPNAARLIRAAGRALGEVLATAVDILNPAAVIVGGDLAAAEETLLTGVREEIYRRSSVLATRSLHIERGSLGERAGVVGSALTVLDVVLAPAEIDRRLDGDYVAFGQATG